MEGTGIKRIMIFDWKIQYIFKNIMIVFPMILFLLYTGGCSKSTSSGKNYYSETSGNQPRRAKQIPEYRLGFGDEVEVKFFNNEIFNERVSVRPDGRITLERVGDLYVTGMTPSELDSLVTVTYADIIRDPEVTVFVRKFGSYQTYVLGEVYNPGGYPVERNMTVMQALAVAGGFKFSAAMGSIIILRQDENAEVHALKVDVNAYLAGEPLTVYFKEQEIEIEMNEFFIKPLDLIYVPKTPIANVVAFLEQVYAGLLPPIDVYLRALLWSRY